MMYGYNDATRLISLSASTVLLDQSSLYDFRLTSIFFYKISHSPEIWRFYSGEKVNILLHGEMILHKMEKDQGFIIQSYNFLVSVEIC